MRNLNIKLILIFTIFGIAISSYALAHHFEFTSGEFCSIGGSLDCDAVNRSRYSEIFGVPVALLGIIFYVSILALTLLKWLKPENKISGFYWNIIFYFSAAGLLFTFYLNFVEMFFIKSFCIVCLMSFAAVLGIFAIAFLVNSESPRSKAS